MDSGLLWHGYEERPTIAVKARKIQNAKRAKKQENFAQCVMSLKWRMNCISFYTSSTLRSEEIFIGEMYELDTNVLTGEELFILLL